MTDYVEQNRRNGEAMLAALRTLDCNPRQTGRSDQYAARCPFHDDDRPSLSLNALEGIFNCFGCGLHGTVREFCAALDARQYPSLILWSGHPSKIEKQRVRRTLLRHDNKEAFPADPERVQRCHQVCLHYWNRWLLEHPDCMALVTGEHTSRFTRKMYDRSKGTLHEEQYEYVSPRFTPETVRRFQIGFAPVSSAELLKQLREDFQTDEILATGLFRRNGAAGLISYFSGRVTYPYLVQGSPVFVIGRITEHVPGNLAGGKYCCQHVGDARYVFPLQRPPIFNVDILENADIVLITEGITDALKATEAGVPAISPGTIAFRRIFLDEIAEKLRGKTVLICNDNEENESGKKGMNEMRTRLQERGIHSHAVMLPRTGNQKKVDVCSYILENGSEAFHTLIHNQTRVSLGSGRAKKEAQEYEEAMEIARREDGYIG